MTSCCGTRSRYMVLSPPILFRSSWQAVTPISCDWSSMADMRGVTYECHVIRDGQSHLLYGGESSESDYVVKGQYGIGAIGAAQQFYRGAQRHIIVYSVAYYHVSVYGQTVFAQRFQIAVLASAHHIDMVRSAYESYAPAAGIYKMLCGQLCRFVTVGCDG